MGAHLDGGLHPDLHVHLLQHVGQGQTVQSGGQHAHVVGTGALHLAAAVLHAPPEVAAAHDHAHLDALVAALLDNAAHAVDHIKIEAPGGISASASPLILMSTRLY